MEQHEQFEFTYSAAQQAEVEKIRKKYTQPTQSKLDQLRALDRSATQKAQTRSLTAGIIGTLVMGTGMSLIMTDIGQILGGFALPVGIVAGLAGMVLVALAYPIYDRTLKKERKRIAPQILQLTDDLLK